jgi:hypothetical protein
MGGGLIRTANPRATAGVDPACRGLVATFQYKVIEGTLPTITNVRLLLVFQYLISMRVLGTHVGCLYQGTIGLAGANPMRFITIQPEQTFTSEINLQAGRWCPKKEDVLFAGSFTFAPEQTMRLSER